MTKTRIAFAVVCLVALGWFAQPSSAIGDGPSLPGMMPVFQADPTWPALPNHWVLGVVSSVAVDARDHVWILHRPRGVPASSGQAAPAVLEFDANGAFVNGWGGPGSGFDWPGNEHGITPDNDGHVWIGGSGATDDMLLKFTVAGQFVLQIGARGQSGGNDDQKNLGRPADAFVDSKAHEIYVADGYGNRRVIVFDSGTGAFKRMWGGMPGFANPVHSIKVSRDGLVYVADRANQRIQVFTPAGQYLKQMFVNRGVASAETVAGLAFSPDPEQRFLYAADYGNSRIAVIDRARLEVLYQFGRTGTGAGDLRSPHLIATDSKGNLYTAEVAPGNRAQKFTFKGLSPAKPPNALP